MGKQRVPRKRTPKVEMSDVVEEVAEVIPLICKTCGKPMDGHLECGACGILVGDGHMVGGLQACNGLMVCGDCRGVVDRRHLGKAEMLTWIRRGDDYAERWMAARRKMLAGSPASGDSGPNSKTAED